MSHSREVAALASKYLTRVHDGESLEDLKPWRTRGVELFVGEHALDISARATRGWQHVPLPECAPSTSARRDDDDSAPEEDDADLSQRLYAAVLRAVIASRGVSLSEDIVPIAEALREALGPSAETHDAALAAAALPRASLPSAPTTPERESYSPGAPEPVAKDATDTVEDASDASDAISVATKPTTDIERVEEDVGVETEPDAPSPGGIFACCFGGAAKPSRKTPSAPKAPEKPPVLPEVEPCAHSVDAERNLAPEAASRTVEVASPAAVTAPAAAVKLEDEQDENLREEEAAKGCATLARALWVAWRRSGAPVTGGPLETRGPAGAAKDASLLVRLPPGWHGVLAAFAEHHGASETTVSLAESMAIARSADALSTSELEGIHVRLAMATSAVASGRATKADAALRDDVAAAVFPVAMRALRVCLAPNPGTDVDDTVARVRALAPTVALCMPLDTPASRFAGVLNRAAARAAVDRVEACLSTPLPGEAAAAMSVAEVVVAVREESDAEDVSGVGDTSKMARSRTEFVDDGPGPGLLEPSGTIRDASTPTFARVAEAARVAAACFPLDVAAFGVLPAGVSAASVASHATASALARAATAATDAVGELCAPPYGVTFETLDSAIADLRTKMRAENLGSSAGALAAGKRFDQNARLALEETLVVLRPLLVDTLRDAAARERGGDITAIAPERGVMHSSSLGDVFAALRDAYVAALPGTVERRRDAFAREHALAVETLVAGAFRWYTEENERACLAEVREARARLRDRRKDGRLDATVAADAALLSRGFHTRLSNIHACVSSLRAFREDCAVLWRSRAASGRDALETRDDSDSSDDEAAVEDGDEDRSSAESASFGDLMRSLRCSRASVIASATELLMDAAAPDFEEAALSPEYLARGAALSRALKKVDAELAAMDAALAAGAFRLAAAAVHRAACACLERLILHRAHDDVGARFATGALVMSGGSLSGTPAPLTEAQHSNVVELASALEEFLSADNDGVPAQVLVDGEQRLRRLLNLWFTPTVEVVREYRRQVEAIVSGGGGARIAGSGGPGRVVRPSHGGGVGPLDLLQLLAQRGADGDAAAEVEAQVSAAAALEAQAVLGLPLGEIVVASFVCREHTTTLGGRLFVTQTRVGFSPCGVGPDHPHDAHGATVAKIEHVTRAWTSEGSGTAAAALHVSLVEGVTIRFECFVGGARARDLALEGLRASAAANRPHSPFLANAAALAPASSGAAMLHGETTRRVVPCAREAFVEQPGTALVTSAAVMWLPVSEDVSEDDDGATRAGGARVAFDDIAADGVESSTRGWRDHCVTVRVTPKSGKRVAPVRFVRLTESSANALRDDILQAIAAFDERGRAAGHG
jgi:hypothetical protein